MRSSIQGRPDLTLVPVSLEEANDFVAEHHRHHQPVPGHKFSVGVMADSGEGSPWLCGVVIVGRPTARMSDNGLTLEVTRLCSDGTDNVCSMLYRTAWRACVAMGYSRLITYTLASEPGGSLRGAGFKEIGLRGGGSWSRPSRPREDKHPTGQKLLWELTV